MSKAKKHTTETCNISPLSGIKKKDLLDYLSKLPDDAHVDVSVEWGYYGEVDGFILECSFSDEEQKASHLEKVAKSMYSC